MPRCLPCGKPRQTPCAAVCHAFTERTKDRIAKQRVIQAKHRLASLTPRNM